MGGCKLFQPADYPKFATELVACACCGGLDYTIAMEGDLYNFGLQTVVCTRCGLLFTNPRPTPLWFQEFYRHNYRIFYKAVITPDENYLNQDWVKGRHFRNLNFLVPYLQKTGTIMDIGASEGVFLNQFRQRMPAWNIRGIEPSENFSKFARDYFGLDTIETGDISDLERTEANQYDLVTANHVIEHLLDPNQFFMVARHLLRDDGLLFLDVPDAEARLRGILAIHIAHVYHFSRQTLTNFLTKYGFEVLAWHQWPHRLPWTVQVLARKTKNAPQMWAPATVDAHQIARHFARNSQNTPEYLVYDFLYRRVYKKVRRFL